MKQPKVTRIHLDYEDGSSDTIEMLPSNTFPVYRLARARARTGSEEPGGAYTTAAIAALLFHTAISTERTDYSPTDKKFAGLLRYWTDASQSES